MKEKLYTYCETFVAERIARIHKNIASIQMALTSETKSSAGDKHETGRAMLQLEREKLGQQLLEAEKMRELLSKVQVKVRSENSSLGSLVFTSKSNYFISISAGEYKVDGIAAYCISANTPIGKLLLGKQQGDSFSFNGELIKILEVA
ncbi:MAG: 3-oxoacyl-ACP synthase [Cellulophaga sp.]